MEFQTSEEAYKVYRKLSDMEEKANRYNRGFTLMNSKKINPNYFISVKKEVKLNLLEKEEEVLVYNNVLPFNWTSYSDGLEVKDFLEELRKYMATPCYELFIQHNRRQENKVSFYWKAKFRKKDFEFEDIDLKIGKLAKEDLDLISLNFIEEVKKIIKNKKVPTDKEMKDFEEYSYLTNRKEDLERHFKGRTSYSYSSYGESRDNTIKLVTINSEEYNSRLKEVEEKMKILCKKYKFLEFLDFDYHELKERKSFEDWRLGEESDAEEEWGDFDDEDKEEYDGDYDNYLKSGYDNYIDCNDFD